MGFISEKILEVKLSKLISIETLSLKTENQSNCSSFLLSTDSICLLNIFCEAIQDPQETPVMVVIPKDAHNSTLPEFDNPLKNTKAPKGKAIS